MANRDYFSLRYAVPGFSFILIIIGLNYLPIFSFILRSDTNNSGLGIVLSFLSLFAGSAIGFLISQVWFLWFNALKLDSRRINKHFEDVISKTTGWKQKKWLLKSILRRNGEERERASVMSAIIDYLLLTEKDEERLNFCQRKWDLYHLLSCTLVSLLMGLGLGLIFRFLIFGGLLSGTADGLLFKFTLVAVVILSFLIFFVRRQVFDEYYQMYRLFFTQRNIDENYKLILRTAFKEKEQYFETKISSQDS